MNCIDRSDDGCETRQDTPDYRADPDYWRQAGDYIAAHKRAVEKNRLDAEPIVAELRRLDYNVDTISDLYHRRMDYRSALPTLLRWLPLLSNLDIKEAIVRALSVPMARPVAAPALIDEFRNAPPDALSYRWAVANALSVVADDPVFDDIVALARDKRYGRAREMLAVALGNMKNPKSVDVLVQLLDDVDLTGHAVMGLGRTKSTMALEHVDRYLDHPTAWIRQEAAKSAKRLRRQLERGRR